MLAVGILTLVANYVTRTAACGVDNSGCARAGATRLWRGRVFTAAGAPVSRAAVRFYFDSNRTPSEQTGRPLSVVTDPRAGTACAGRRRNQALVTISSGTPGERLSLSAGRHCDAGSLVPDRERRAGADSDEPRLATGLGCDRRMRDRSPPWYRVENLKNNWRYRLLVYGPLLSMLLTVAGAGSRRSTRFGRWTSWAGGALAAAGALLFVLVWVTHWV